MEYYSKHIRGSAMKTKVYNKSYDEVMALPRKKHKKPIKPNILFRTLMLVASIPDIFATRFKANKIGMEKLGKKEPAFFVFRKSKGILVIASFLP